MLILTRKARESLMIGDDITVTVLGVKGSQVRIGIEAPGEVGVYREEVYRRGRGGNGRTGPRRRGPEEEDRRGG